MSKRIYTLFIFLLPTLLLSQVVSNGGRFAVDFDLGCVPHEVNITELDGFGMTARQYFYFEGGTETTSKSFTRYTSAGTYQIVQVIGIATPRTDTLTVQVIDPTETNFSIGKCNANGIPLTSEEQVYDSIRVYFTVNDSATIAFGQTASFNYMGASLQTFQTKGLYNSAKENCTTFTHNVTPLSSLTTPTITSADLKETCLDNFVLLLNIQNYDSLIDYQIEFDQTSSSIVYEGKIASDVVIIEEINYSKSESEYCVRINALDNCTNARVTGNSFCQDITELSSTPFSNLYSSYTDNGIFINLDSVFSGNLLVHRKLGTDGSLDLRATVQNAYTDPAGSLSRQYFYRIDYMDSCNQLLYSAETNPPLISSRTRDENKYQITMVDATNVFSEIVSTTYEIGNGSTVVQPITSSTFDIGLDPMNGTRQFLRVSIEYANGITILSNQLTYKYKSIIHVPNAFTPNNDGLNDTLELFGLPN